MTPFRRFTNSNVRLLAALVCALAWLAGNSPIANAAAPPTPPVQTADDGWQSKTENPFRNAAHGEWSPSRNQLRGSATPEDASKPQPLAAVQAASSAPQRVSEQVTRNNAVQAAASADSGPEHRWDLPKQSSQSQPVTTAYATNAAPREPRSFAPAAQAATLPVPANQRIAASNTTTMPPRNGATAAAHTASPIAPSRHVATPNESIASRYGSMSQAGPPRATHRPAPKNNSYTGRLWQTVNVAFQGPDQWDGGVQPEGLPMPGGAHESGSMHMGSGHIHSPYEMGMEGCADGSCSMSGGCGCGQMGCAGGCGDGMCGCGDGCGCGDMCEPGCGCEPSCGCGSSSCGTGCICDGLCLGVGDDASCHTIRVRVPKWQELTILGGVHGFKGPYDQDRDSGNFGFHEAINAGFKVPYTNMGYQLGYQAVHSQLNGDEQTGDSNSHTQHFVTAGIFQRAKDGLQGGIAWDMLRDERFTSVDFHQLRGELSFIDRGCHELGVAVAFGLNEHEVPSGDVAIASTFYLPTDQYLAFYRFHGKNGGEGRFFGGWNDVSDGIVGADMLLPLSDRWSLMANFAYLIPEEGGPAGASHEAWNVSTGLVWHWDCRARRSHSNCYRPLFNVADNGYLIIDGRPGSLPVAVPATSDID